MEHVKTRIEGLRAVIAEEIQRALVNPLEKLKELKHTGSVENYVAEFQLYSSQCELLPEQKLLGYFISGLRHDIRSRVRMFKPRNCELAMQWARDVEREFAEESRSGYKMGPNSWARPQKQSLAHQEDDGKSHLTRDRFGEFQVNHA